ncbi:MAG: hypothetical protein HN576_14620 [Bacteriovoracaceae bacterium]|jgi:hypothetical protein|nr:hypothetical protein [Bacteriovoracaceae bacterium]
MFLVMVFEIKIRNIYLPNFQDLRSFLEFSSKKLSKDAKKWGSSFNLESYFCLRNKY